MEGRQPIVFVVRASVRDGLGHLVRSLGVLRELALLHPVKLLLLGDRSGSHLIDDAQIPWDHCTSDQSAARKLRRSGSGLVVFDTLRFDEAAFSSIPSGVTTVSLSPVFDQMHRIAHLFHRTAVESPQWRAFSAFPKVHKGLRYAVLPPWLKRVSQRHYREQLQEERLAVAISMGGTDAPNRTLALLKLFGESRSRLVLYVALGDAYTHSYEELLACAAQNRQEIILLKSNESMWRVLQSVSLVICAGGLTTYEAAFMGLPAINILQDARWSWLFAELSEAGACMTLPPEKDCLQKAVRRVSAMDRDRSRLLAMHMASRNLIPKNGSLRIARKLAQIAASAEASDG